MIFFLLTDSVQEQLDSVLELSVWQSQFLLSVKCPTTPTVFTNSWRKRQESKQVCIRFFFNYLIWKKNHMESECTYIVFILNLHYITIYIYFHFLLSFRLCEDRVTVSGSKSGSLYLSEASGIQTKVRYHNFCFNAYTFESSCWVEFIIIVVICNADIDRLVLFFPFVLITTHNVCLCFPHSSESWESTVILLSPKR